MHTNTQPAGSAEWSEEKQRNSGMIPRERSLQSEAKDIRNRALRVIGPEDVDFVEQRELKTRSDFEQKLDVLIKEYFQRGIALEHASKKKEKRQTQREMDQVEEKIRMLILHASQYLPESEIAIFLESVRGRISGLAAAKEVDMNMGALRRALVGIVGGGASGAAETTEKVARETKTPVMNLVGHLAEILTGALAEVLKGLGRGVSRLWRKTA